MHRCWWCSGELIWDRDCDAAEYCYDESVEGICTYLHCSRCEATVLYLPPECSDDMWG